MLQSFKLKPGVWHEPTLSFEWDSETGELLGEDEVLVLSLVNNAVAEGCVAIHPLPSSYNITDPLRNPDQMAAVLGLNWSLPEELKAVYPKVETESSEIEVLDAAGLVVDTIQILY